jgi:hypothetical protein
MLDRSICYRVFGAAHRCVFRRDLLKETGKGIFDERKWEVLNGRFGASAAQAASELNVLFHKNPRLSSHETNTRIPIPCSVVTACDSGADTRRTNLTPAAGNSEMPDTDNPCIPPIRPFENELE